MRRLLRHRGEWGHGGGGSGEGRAPSVRKSIGRAGEEETGRAGVGVMGRPSQVSVLGLSDTEWSARHPGRCQTAQKRVLTADRSVESAAHGQSLEAVTG